MSKVFSTVFVFQESIEKTNIQKGELLALLELQSNTLYTQIANTEDFEPFHDEFGFITYENTILSESDYHEVKVLFFSQCAVVFSNFELDIKEILRRAGYIQSVGKLIYLTKWEKIDADKLIQLLLNYTDFEQKRRQIIYYIMGDNAGIDQKLSNLLIDEARYHIGQESFQKASEKITKTLYDSYLSRLLLNEGKEPFFFIKDTGEIVDQSPLKRLYPDRNIIEYSICYISEFKKDNSIHYLDDIKECKPFWAGIYTTPHRLMNAMLNLAKVSKDSIVVDPFSHTGTVAIEASQIGCEIKAFDLHEILGAKDNYNFLCKGGANILRLCKLVSNKIKDKILTEELQRILADSITLNPQGLPEVIEGRRIENLIEEKDLFKEYENRIYFYLLRRYQMEILRRAKLQDGNPIDFARRHVRNDNLKNIEHVEENYYTFFGKQLMLFEEANKENKFPVIFLSEDENNKNGECFTDSKYKTNRIGYTNNSKSDPVFELHDILEDNYNIPDNSVDAIITDPPYGYGEELDEEMVNKIYTALFEKSFKWLKPMGTLVFCALDKVKTGRRNGLLFTEEILALANFVARKNNVMFNLNYIYPVENQKTCVYYWKSKYALNRSIIVLKINK